MRRIAPHAPILAILAACGSSPDVVTRPIVVHVPAACALGNGPIATYLAAGDFQPSGSDNGTAVSLDDVGASIAAIPSATRAISAAVKSTASGDRTWQGLAEVPTDGDVDVLVLPDDAPCVLSQPESGPLRATTEAAVGVIDGRRVLVAGGASADRSAAGSFVVDFATGAITPTVNGLRIPRTGATVTPFGDGALVAGGANLVTDENLASAEVFTGGKFEQAPLVLFEGRTLHGAVVLDSGETLLVGGRGAHGPLGSIEAIDPVTRDYRTGLPALDHPRVSPTVFRLATGEIFVAGGYDDQGNVVQFVEWFAFDAGRHVRTRGLVGTPNQGFVPLAGGGALAVIGLKRDNNVWVISREGDIASAPPISPPLNEVRLFPGSGGAPILWTGDRWLRWDPWRGEFTPMPKVANVGPETDAIVSPDDGLAAWITRAVDLKDPTKDGMQVFGLRFDRRSAYTTDSAEGALLVSDTAKFAPDRLITPADTTIAFDVTRGIVLAAGATAYLTDATFASFHLDLDVTGSAPLVVLRHASGPAYGIEVEIGGPTCPLTVPDGTKAIHVTRTGDQLLVALDQNDARPCPNPLPADVRVSVGLRGIGDESSAKNFVITRR